jgi:hypothetical protein
VEAEPAAADEMAGLTEAMGGGATELRAERGEQEDKDKVRKTPSWPRSWANFSRLLLYSGRNA